MDDELLQGRQREALGHPLNGLVDHVLGQAVLGDVAPGHVRQGDACDVVPTLEDVSAAKPAAPL